MIKKLIIAALITTPLIVFNGVLPIYLEGQVSVQQALRMASIIGSFASLIWLINLMLVSKVPVAKKWHLYAISYAAVLVCERSVSAANK